MKLVYQIAVAISFFLPLLWLLFKECPRCVKTVGLQLWIAYLNVLHRRIMQSDPSHPEAVRTMLEIRRAQARLDAVWEAA